MENKKDKEDIKKQVTRLENSIKENTKEIINIQVSCKHPKESIKIKDVNPTGTSDLRTSCGLCGHILGYPTQNELDGWCSSKK